MSRISDVLIEINEYLDSDLSEEEIAEQVGCPQRWVTQEREENLREEQGFYYAIDFKRNVFSKKMKKRVDITV